MLLFPGRIAHGVDIGNLLQLQSPPPARSGSDNRGPGTARTACPLSARPRRKAPAPAPAPFRQPAASAAARSPGSGTRWRSQRCRAGRQSARSSSAPSTRRSSNPAPTPDQHRHHIGATNGRNDSAHEESSKVSRRRTALQTPNPDPRPLQRLLIEARLHIHKRAALD